MSKTTLKAAIIGAGFFGGIQAEAWSRIRNVELVGVADPDQGRAHQFGSQWNIPGVFADAEALIKKLNPDFVDIATRPDTHLALVELAASTGCDCICQKPMAPSLADCKTMVEACESSNVRLLIHENWRWQPWYRAAKRAICEQNFGEIFHLRFHVRTGDGFGPDAYTVQPYFTEMNRFLIYETLIHHLDTARLIAGEVESIYCQTQRVNPKIAGEDCVAISINFSAGATGVIDANRINGENPAPKVFGLLEVECELGAVRIDADGAVWTRNYKTQTEEVKFDYVRADGGYRGDSVLAVQQHMLDCLASGEMCESEGREYLKSVQLVEACYQSAESNRVVAIDSNG